MMSNDLHKQNDLTYATSFYPPVTAGSAARKALLKTHAKDVIAAYEKGVLDGQNQPVVYLNFRRYSDGF